jgi:RNA polymerase sigma-70 factor (ECF subfamily)
MREGKTVDIEEQSSTLVATTDPTVARQLHELDRALAQVPEDQRQVILLVGLEGMSYKDAAAILSVPVGTIRSRLSRGRDALRELMGMGERTDGGPWAQQSFAERNGDYRSSACGLRESAGRI